MRSLTDRIHPWEWLFLLVAGMLGAWILLSATSVYGAGVSSDSMFYISSADNFARGRGFFDFKGDALIDFPPLYPLILGILTWATHVSPFVIGRYANAAILAALIVSTGVLIRRCLPERKLWLYLGTLAMLLFLPLYPLAAIISTDVLYMLLSVWFCLAAQSFMENRSLIWLAAMTILAAAGAFLRWVGLALPATEFILLWIAYRSQPKKALLAATLFSGLAGLPVVLWVGVRNRLLAGTMGRIQVEGQKVDILQNLQISFARISAWIAPEPARYGLPVLVVLLAAILLLNRKQDYRRWLVKLFSQAVFPLILLTGIYFAATVATGYTADHLLSYDNRYQVPLFACLLVILFISLDELVLAHLKGILQPAVLVWMVGILGLWGYYQGGLISQFVQTSREQGIVEYNEYNNKRMLRSGLVVYLLDNPPNTGMTLYSNEPEAVYFFLRRPVEMSPSDPAHYYASEQVLTAQYPHWPPEGQAYLIWFKPNVKRQYFSPDEIEKIARLEKLYKRYDGEVYLASPKP